MVKIAIYIPVLNEEGCLILTLDSLLPFQRSRVKRAFKTKLSTPKCSCQTFLFQMKLTTIGRINAVRSESRCALRLWYVNLVINIEVAVDITSDTFYKCTEIFRTQI
jgi:hypothetical protein